MGFRGLYQFIRGEVPTHWTEDTKLDGANPNIPELRKAIFNEFDALDSKDRCIEVLGPPQGQTDSRDSLTNCRWTVKCAEGEIEVFVGFDIINRARRIQFHADGDTVEYSSSDFATLKADSPLRVEHAKRITKHLGKYTHEIWVSGELDKYSSFFKTEASRRSPEKFAKIMSDMNHLDIFKAYCFEILPEVDEYCIAFGSCLWGSVKNWILTNRYFYWGKRKIPIEEIDHRSPRKGKYVDIHLKNSEVISTGAIWTEDKTFITDQGLLHYIKSDENEKANV